MSESERQLENKALEGMISMAKGLGIENGVGFVLLLETEAEVYPRIAFEVIGLIGDPDPNKGEGSTNCFAVVMSILARMMSTAQDSSHSDSPLNHGEVRRRGGLIRPFGSGVFFAGFYGGTEDQDFLVAKVGMDVLLA